MQQRRRGPSRNAFRCAFHVGSQLASESAPTSGFLTFSNVAVGNGREWAGADGSQSSEKPYRITRIGSGRDSPEPPRSGSNPAGATNSPYFTRVFTTFSGSVQQMCNRGALFSLPGGLQKSSASSASPRNTWRRNKRSNLSGVITNLRSKCTVYPSPHHSAVPYIPEFLAAPILLDGNRQWIFT